MMPHAESLSDSPSDGAGSASPPPRQLTLAEAETVLGAMADLHFLTEAASKSNADASELRTPSRRATDEAVPILEARYRTLLEQISAIVFMAYLDRGIGEGYVSPQIEATLGFSQQEWLEDPIRWYQQIHPEDKERWSLEAADMFSFRASAAVGLSRPGSRWTRGLVSVRSQDGQTGERYAVVHPGAWRSMSPKSQAS